MDQRHRLVPEAQWVPVYPRAPLHRLALLRREVLRVLLALLLRKVPEVHLLQKDPEGQQAQIHHHLLRSNPPLHRPKAEKGEGLGGKIERGACVCAPGKEKYYSTWYTLKFA